MNNNKNKRFSGSSNSSMVGVVMVEVVPGRRTDIIHTDTIKQNSGRSSSSTGSSSSNGRGSTWA